MGTVQQTITSLFQKTNDVAPAHPTPANQLNSNKRMSIATTTTTNNKKQKQNQTNATTTTTQPINFQSSATADPFQPTEAALEAMHGLDYLDGMSEEDKIAVDKIEKKRRLERLHWQCKHSMLRENYINQYFNDEALAGYSSKFKERQRYKAILKPGVNLDKQFPLADAIFQAYRKRLERRHLPETIRLAKEKKIASKTVLRGVSVFILLHFTN